MLQTGRFINKEFIDTIIYKPWQVGHTPSPPSRRLPRQSLSARRTPTRRRRDYAVLIVCPGWRGRGPFRVRSSAVRPSSSPSPPPPPKPTEWQEVVEAATVSVVSQSRYSAGCSDFPPYGRQ
ncbi:hypothetical protein QTP88_023072 [Uroleucon formosanum]